MNNIKGSGEALGEALKANKSLKELNLEFCSLGPEDGKGLAGGVKAAQPDSTPKIDVRAVYRR